MNSDRDGQQFRADPEACPLGGDQRYLESNPLIDGHEVEHGPEVEADALDLRTAPAHSIRPERATACEGGLGPLDIPRESIQVRGLDCIFRVLLIRVHPRREHCHAEDHARGMNPYPRMEAH
jgi:hypothetical protein